MTMSGQMQLLKAEYSNSNFQKASELADTIITSSSEDSYHAIAWLYKGLCIAPMSTINQQRLTNAVQYFREAQKHSPDPTMLASGAVQLSGWTIRHAKQLASQYADESERRVSGQRGKVNHGTNEDIGQYAGREIGQALFDLAESANRQRKSAVTLGQHFENNHSAAIVATLDYAYSTSLQNIKVAQNIADVTEVVTGMIAIMPGSRRRFVAAIDPLVHLVWSSYRDLSFYEVRKEEQLICPHCGYTFVKKAGGFLGGVFSSYIKSAKPGQQLVCETCGNEWKY
jgi:hypothetical protein